MLSARAPRLDRVPGSQQRAAFQRNEQYDIYRFQNYLSFLQSVAMVTPAASVRDRPWPAAAPPYPCVPATTLRRHDARCALVWRRIFSGLTEAHLRCASNMHDLARRLRHRLVVGKGGGAAHGKRQRRLPVGEVAQIAQRSRFTIFLEAARTDTAPTTAGLVAAVATHATSFSDSGKP